MTYKESLVILKEMSKKYSFTSEEKEAFANVLYQCKLKAKEEENTPDLVWTVAEYSFHRFQDAQLYAKNTGAKHIIEKRKDSNGNMKAKKYTVLNGKILNVRMM